MRFVDRQDAAAQLADALGHYRGQRALVLALPRGGVPLGRVLADALQADLDVVLVRKLGAPGDPEFALGAVAEDGWTYLAPYAEPTAGSALPEHVRAEELERIRQRRARYTPPCGGTLCGRPRGHRGGRRAGHRGHHDRRAARRARRRRRGWYARCRWQRPMACGRCRRMPTRWSACTRRQASRRWAPLSVVPAGQRRGGGGLPGGQGLTAHGPEAIGVAAIRHAAPEGATAYAVDAPARAIWRAGACRYSLSQPQPRQQEEST